jgi:hypothetical protein
MNGTGIVWRATAERGREMSVYCATSAPTPRFSWAGPTTRELARVLEEPEEGDLTRSAEWVILNEGDRVYRINDKDLDSPLRIERATPRGEST